jgi:anti-sigma factor RsiW
VSCEQAREQFSALVDETLTREERADVYAHLATCADCRRELAALERTVALVRGATPVRAPDGFVDRVVTAARPTPWSVKIARGAFSPWPVKIPLGAAALLLVAGLAVLLFRGLETQQRVAQPETPTMASDRAAPAAPAPPAAVAPAAPAPPAARQATPDEAMRVRPESPSVGIAPKLADAPGPSRNDTSLDERKALLAEKREPEADVRALLATPEPDAA